MARKVFERCLIRQATMRDDLLITRDVVVSAVADRDLAALVGEEPAPVGFCA
jgi:sulfur transfer complex TusBCD TusB component (DsrH family)